MPFLDILALVVLATGAWLGLKAGMVRTLSVIIALILAVAGAVILYQPASTLISEHVAEARGAWLRPVVFVILFILINWLVNLAGSLLRRIARAMFLSGLDRLGGLVLGVVIAFAALAIPVALASNIAVAQEWLLESRFGRVVLTDLQLPAIMASPEVQQRLSVMEELIREGYEILPEMSSDQLRELLDSVPATTDATESESAQE